MFDDLVKTKSNDFPRDLENMSIAELMEYVDELNVEIKRVQEDAKKKKASHDAAARAFK